MKRQHYITLTVDSLISLNSEHWYSLLWEYFRIIWISLFQIVPSAQKNQKFKAAIINFLKPIYQMKTTWKRIWQCEKGRSEWWTWRKSSPKSAAARSFTELYQLSGLTSVMFTWLKKDVQTHKHNSLSKSRIMRHIKLVKLHNLKRHSTNF